MSRAIKFRAWSDFYKIFLRPYAYPNGHSNLWMAIDDGVLYHIEHGTGDDGYCDLQINSKRFDGVIIEQYTGLKDKNGKEIYEGDIVRIRTPYRTTQTHTGDNIPNGSYTEPMEPGIRTVEAEVLYDKGMFFLNNEDVQSDFTQPLLWQIREWDLESIKDAISWTRQSANWFDDPEEGDLQYLITEVAKLETAKQLINYLSGIEIIGNIHENPELLQ